MTPTTRPSRLIHTLYNRHPTTEWADREVRAYKKIAKAYPSEIYLIRDIELISKYYVSERKKGEKGIHRRDLLTFLNNFSGELDRAREWQSRFSKTRSDSPQPKPHLNRSTDEDYQRAGLLAKQEIARLRQQLSP